jgi:single-stranded-DNA-specific exonuclease
VEKQEKVGVFGDFDVDGITGTAIITEGLTQLGVPVMPYLPHRTDEGHGLSIDAVEKLVQQGVRLIITVDCGVTSVAEVTQARRIGADVIITDHHTPPFALPDAVAIVNPRVPGNLYPFGDLSGSGLAFKLIQGIFQFYGVPWDRSLLELAALGTIADLVPLQDENRFLVSHGLDELGRTKRPGLLALYERAGIQPGYVNAEAVSYQIAPRLNSAGRMSHAIDSLRLLTTQSDAEGKALAEKLEGLNQDRRALSEQSFAVACDRVQQLGPPPAMLIVEDPCFTPGVTGLVAGRLVDLFHRPAVVLSAVSNDYLMASARSIPEFNIIQAFSACADLFVRYGGHAQAAGFTVRRGNLPLLTERLTDLAEQARQSQDWSPSLSIDAEVRLTDLTDDLLRWLTSLQPWGTGNPPATFVSRRVQVMEHRYLGESGQHLRLRVRQGGQAWTALAFNQADRWHEGTSHIDVVYSISTDRWQGVERSTLKIADFRPVAG